MRRRRPWRGRLEVGEHVGVDCGGAFVSVNCSTATIIIDQKGKYNALRLQTWRALPQLVAYADQLESVKLVVLRGADGNFGSGNDISEFGAVHGDPEAARAFGYAMADAMRAVETASKPVLVAIEGACFGASVALALSGDLRVAASDSTFAITPAKLGVVYLKSDLHRLVMAIGAGPAKQLIFSAKAISATRAQQIGLVDEVLPAAAFETGLSHLVDSMLERSQFTLRQTKRMLRELDRAPTPAETDESLAWFVDATQGADFKEGVDSFLAKRPPRFR